jgi:hypothetical protein
MPTSLVTKDITITKFPSCGPESHTLDFDPEWEETWTWDPEEGYPQTDVMNPPE